MKKLLLALILLLASVQAYAQPAVPRPAQFRFGIRVLPGVRPTDPHEGEVYQDRDDHKIYIYNGSSWVQLGGVEDTGTSGQVLTSQGTGTPVWADVSGDGVPGGSNNQVQYKNGGSFAGSAGVTVNGTGFTSNLVNSTTGTWLKNTSVATAESTEHFTFVIGSASNDVPPGDTRPDLVASIGWNANGAATALLPNGTYPGSSQLSFESYCSFGTGCLGGGGGQSETYFAMDDGNGHSVRPLGFFQHKLQDLEAPGYLHVIARANLWQFFDADQTAPIMAIDQPDNVGEPGGVRLFDSVLSFSSEDLPYTFITFSGNNALGRGSDGIEVGRAGSVSLAPGGDGSSYVLVNPTSFRMASGGFYDTNGVIRGTFGAGSATNYPSIAASGTDEIILKPLGSTTDIQLTLQSQGNGNVRTNPSGTGQSLINGHVVLSKGMTPTVTSTTSNSCGTTAPSVAGSDAAGKITVGATSGTSCTLTFSAAYVFAPACVANGVSYTRITSTTSAAILTGTFAAGEVISYICVQGQ